MNISADLLLDRAKLKRKLTFWRVLSVLALSIAAAATVMFSSDSLPSGDYIARYSLEGVIIEDIEREELFNTIKEDKHVKAVVLRINSPGGTVTGGETLYNQIKEISQVKPVVSVIKSMGTSAAYMAALGGERIYVHESSLTGSIGVLFQTAEVTELAEKIGIKPIEVKSSPLKASPSMFEKVTPESEAALKEIIGDMYSYFANLVKERRGFSEEELAKVANGKAFSGKRALELKLVDAIGGEAEARQWLIENKSLNPDIKIVDVEIKEKDFGFLSELDSIAKIIENRAKSLTTSGIISIWSAQ